MISEHALASKEDSYATQHDFEHSAGRQENTFSSLSIRGRICARQAGMTIVPSSPFISRAERPIPARRKRLEVLPYKGAERGSECGWNCELHHLGYPKTVVSMRPLARMARVTGRSSMFRSPTTRPIPVAVNADATKAYLLAPYGERQVENLYRIGSNATGEYTPLFDDPSGSINDWVVDPVTQQPVVGISYVDRSRFHYVDDPDKQRREEFTRCWCARSRTKTSRSPALLA